jgi:hypothetical protein
MPRYALYTSILCARSRLCADFYSSNTISTIIQTDSTMMTTTMTMLCSNQQPVLTCDPTHSMLSSQRIKDRHFYTETGNYTFVVEVPLDEWCSGIPSK